MIKVTHEGERWCIEGDYTDEQYGKVIEWLDLYGDDEEMYKVEFADDGLVFVTNSNGEEDHFGTTEDLQARFNEACCAFNQLRVALGESEVPS